MFVPTKKHNEDKSSKYCFNKSGCAKTQFGSFNFTFY